MSSVYSTNLDCIITEDKVRGLQHRLPVGEMHAISLHAASLSFTLRRIYDHVSSVVCFQTSRL